MPSTKENILLLLEEGSFPVKEIADRLGLKLTTASEAIRQLKLAKKVETERVKLTEGKARKQTVVTLTGVDIKLSPNVKVTPTQKVPSDLPPEPVKITPKVTPTAPTPTTTVTIPQLKRTKITFSGPRIVDTIGFFEFLKTHNKKLWERYRPKLIDPISGRAKWKPGKLANDFRNLVSAYNLYYSQTHP